MRSPKFRIIGLVAVAALLAALGSAIAAEGDGDGDDIAVTGADQALVDGLLALQDDLPELVPTAAQLAANEIDPVLLGSFTTARSTLDRLEDDIRALFIDGDAAGTAVGDAVAAVAQGLLIERQAHIVLEQGDGSTNPRPLDSSNARDDDGIAIDADGLLGLETTGIDLLLQARDLQRAGYEVLATVEAADAAFADRLAELRAYEDEVAVTLRVVTSADTDELLVPATRWDAPIGVARATSVTYVCVDRAAYLALADLPMEERIAASVEEVPSQECADIARRAGLSLEDQQALQDSSGAAATDEDESADADS